MRKATKFARGGSTDRAKARMDRRMADIEKDYQIALAKGRSPREARAKRDQRIADAKDDYAKRTGADRTQTRAAERAAEANLRATRRGTFTRSTKPLNVTREGAKPVTTAKVDTPKVDTPKVDTPRARTGYDDMSFRAAFAQAMRDKGEGNTFRWRGTTYKLERARPSSTRGSAAGRGTTRGSAAGRGTIRGIAPARAREKRAAERTQALMSGPLPDPRNLAREEGYGRKSLGRYMAETSARRQQAQINELFGLKKGGKVKKYAKGGKIDGCAVRGKTRAARKTPMKKGK